MFHTIGLSMATILLPTLLFYGIGLFIIKKRKLNNLRKIVGFLLALCLAVFITLFLKENIESDILVLVAAISGSFASILIIDFVYSLKPIGTKNESPIESSVPEQEKAKLTKRILQILAVCVFLAFIAIGATEYIRHLEQEKELHYKTKMSWSWHSGTVNHIQIAYNKDAKKSVLRKVNLTEKYIVYAAKDDDYNLITTVLFYTPCTPNSTIVTSHQYSDGEPVTLTCNEGGEYLEYYVLWKGHKTENDFIWSEDIDGFKFYVNFGWWDFSKLNQEITLSKAIAAPSP